MRCRADLPCEADVGAMRRTRRLTGGGIPLDLISKEARPGAQRKSAAGRRARRSNPIAVASGVGEDAYVLRADAVRAEVRNRAESEVAELRNADVVALRARWDSHEGAR